jgi:SH3-like domain-containing protein
MAAKIVFTVNGEPIETVKDFKYLGRILSDNDSDEAFVERNLKRAKGAVQTVHAFLSKSVL